MRGGRNPGTENVRLDKVTTLKRSFEDFNLVTRKLQEAFASLELKFEGINRELEDKNIRLEKAVDEKDRVKNYLQSILESLTTGVIVTDRDEKITLMNPCAELFYGVKQQAMAGKPVGALLQGMASRTVTPERRRTIIGEPGRKMRIRGRTIEVLDSAVRTASGEIIGSVYILRDITAIEKLEDMAKRSEKLTAMGELAANVAHEIRNPLGSIELFASLLMKDLKDRRSRERVSQIIASVRNVDNKLSNLLLFTKKREPLMKEVDLHGILEEVISFCGEIVAQEGVSLSARYARGPAHVQGDAELLKQVFLNIILNAFQAMPGGGALEIETRMIGDAENLPGVGSLVDVRFSDTGVGIPAEHLAKIFDPFFSTREKGSGLGLAIVHSIIDMHGGSIDVESREGGGTIVSVMLPLAVKLLQTKRRGRVGSEGRKKEALMKG
jgi:PAS domain S-box-containing protein